jgi:NADPH-dependent curcumin reductase CurA
MNEMIILRSAINRGLSRPVSKHTLKSIYQFNCSITFGILKAPRRTFTKATPFKMKEAIVAKGPKVTVHNVPVPKPNDDQVLIKVIYSGSNPKDWKGPHVGEPHNSGDDISGIVEAVGANVTEFKKGDRVAAFHEMKAPHGSFAEYAIAWAYTTFHLPKKTSFEEV